MGVSFINKKHPHWRVIFVNYDNMGKKFGFSWSWKRAFGIQKIRQDIARFTGIPTTKLGRQRKLGSIILKFFFGNKH